MLREGSNIIVAYSSEHEFMFRRFSCGQHQLQPCFDSADQNFIGNIVSHPFQLLSENILYNHVVMFRSEKVLIDLFSQLVHPDPYLKQYLIILALLPHKTKLR